MRGVRIPNLLLKKSFSSSILLLVSKVLRPGQAEDLQLGHTAGQAPSLLDDIPVTCPSSGFVPTLPLASDPLTQAGSRHFLQSHMCFHRSLI